MNNMESHNTEIQALAETAANEIIQAKGDAEKIGRILSNLKRQVGSCAASIASPDFYKFVNDPDLFLWELTKNEPDFEIGSLTQARLSWYSLAVAVILGWILGGIASTFLGLFDLGGDILRAGGIYLFVWLEDYFASTPSARKRFLKYAGWVSLAGVATRIGSGFFTLGSIRTLVFGSGRAGIFKGIWLFLGVLFIFVFFSRKRSSPALSLLKEKLALQIESRIAAIVFVLDKISSMAKTLAEYQDKGRAKKNDYCPRNDCVLANGMLEIVDSLDPVHQQYVKERLVMAGFDPDAGGAFGEELIWNGSEHSGLYDTVGFVRDGDKCVILKRPIVKNDSVKRGLVQAITQARQ